MKKRSKKNCILLFLAVVLPMTAVGAWNYQKTTPCPICSGLRCHAPCLINLYTGEIGEIALYDPNPFKTGELAQVQRDGYFSFFFAAGIPGVKIARPWTANMDVPANSKPMRKFLYCQKCRKLLEPVTREGYALLDLYDRAAPVVLPLRGGVEYKLRCYHVTILANEADRTYHLKVEGTWEP